MRYKSHSSHRVQLSPRSLSEHNKPSVRQLRADEYERTPGHEPTPLMHYTLWSAWILRKNKASTPTFRYTALAACIFGHLHYLICRPTNLPTYQATPQPFFLALKHPNPSKRWQKPSQSRRRGRLHPTSAPHLHIHASKIPSSLQQQRSIQKPPQPTVELVPSMKTQSRTNMRRTIASKDLANAGVPFFTCCDLSTPTETTGQEMVEHC